MVFCVRATTKKRKKRSSTFLGKKCTPINKILAMPMRVVNRWNLLDQWTVDAPSLNAFKNGLSKIRNNQMGFFME